MTIQAVSYRLRCDQPQCSAEIYYDNYSRLWDLSRAEGWTLRRKLNGELALRGGKDYCPQHRRGGQS